MINTEVVSAKDIPAVSERGSMYSAAISQALGLKKGEALKIMNPENKHLRNTMYQLIARKKLTETLRVAVSNKEVYLVKI